MRTFTINGNQYKAAPFDFNLICDMEDMGFDIQKISERPRTATRAYLACCAGSDVTFAGSEIEKHLISGGNLEEMIAAMNHEMEQSDFFQYMQKTAEKETAENQTETE